MVQDGVIEPQREDITNVNIVIENIVKVVIEKINQIHENILNYNFYNIQLLHTHILNKC